MPGVRSCVARAGSEAIGRQTREGRVENAEAMSDGADGERIRLRERRAELDAHTERLRQESVDLSTSQDRAALKAHNLRLRQHLEHVHDFIKDLEEFHRL